MRAVETAITIIIVAEDSALITPYSIMAPVGLIHMPNELVAKILDYTSTSSLRLYISIFYGMSVCVHWIWVLIAGEYFLASL